MADANVPTEQSQHTEADLIQKDEKSRPIKEVFIAARQKAHDRLDGLARRIHAIAGEEDRRAANALLHQQDQADEDAEGRFEATQESSNEAKRQRVLTAINELMNRPADRLSKIEGATRTTRFIEREARDWRDGIQVLLDNKTQAGEDYNIHQQPQEGQIVVASIENYAVETDDKGHIIRRKSIVLDTEGKVKLLIAERQQGHWARTSKLSELPDATDEDITQAFTVMQELQKQEAVRNKAKFRKELSEATDISKFLTADYDHYWKDPSLLWAFSVKHIDIVGQAKIQEKRAFTEEERRFRAKLLESFGLTKEQADSTYRTWASFSASDPANGGELSEAKVKEFQSILRNNLGAMVRLYENDPESVAQLQKEYGIQNYGRYHEERLLWQLHNPNAKIDQVYLAGATDWNGALLDSSKNLYGIETYREKTTKTVFIEAATVATAADRMQDIATKRGRIKRLIINAHANSHLIELSTSPNGKVTQSNISELIRPGVILPGSVAILIGCDVGSKIAKDFSEVTGMRTISPEGKPGSVEKRYFRNIEFKDKDNMPIPTRIYGPNKVTAAMRRMVARPRYYRPSNSSE